MDVVHHPHATSDWIYRKGPVGAWWDTKYGPDGNFRNTGPNNDEQRRVLVINSGLTREQYVEWNPDVVAPFIHEAPQVGPQDVWVDLEPPLYRHQGNKLLLCKSDTLPSERDELRARGFTYLGSRGDLMYFDNPFGDIDMTCHTDTYYEVPRVRIIIQRDACMCSSYHKENKPSSAWDWSRVGFDGIPPRAPPVQPEETAEARREREVREQKSVEYEAEMREKAAQGDGRASFLVSLMGMRDSMREAAIDELRKRKSTNT
jgi:hypothetical protein